MERERGERERDPPTTDSAIYLYALYGIKTRNFYFHYISHTHTHTHTHTHRVYTHTHTHIQSVHIHITQSVPGHVLTISFFGAMVASLAAEAMPVRLAV